MARFVGSKKLTDSVETGWLGPAQPKEVILESDDLSIAQEIAQKIASAVSRGFELNPDGSEDPVRAAYVEGIRTAWSIASSFTEGR